MPNTVEYLLQQHQVHGLPMPERREVKAGEVLVSPGLLGPPGFAVESGCLRSYVLDKQGRDHTIQFAPEGWIIGDMQSIKEHDRAGIYIEAIEPSTVYVFRERIFEEMRDADPSTRAHSHRLLINRIVAIQKRLILQISASAEERYDDFLKTYPELAKRISLKHIASYIGIAPESLSRIRKHIATKES